MTNIKLDLRNVDLNLLVAFEALLETRSVTKAAEVLCIGQPAASHALKRLRELFSDPLFVRGPEGMVPTARALAVAGRVRTALSQLETVLLSQMEFDPHREARNFRVGATDYAQVVVLKPLLDRLFVDAPNCRLIASTTNCEVVRRELERGEIDLAVGVFPQNLGISHKRTLFDDDFACLFDPQACGVSPPLTHREWLSLPHVMMSTRADFLGPLDEILQTAGSSRFVAASTPSFMAIPPWLKGTRAIATMPERFAAVCAQSFGLAISPPPVRIAKIEVAMFWHSRTHREPGCIWLRETIANAQMSPVSGAMRSASE